MDEVVYSILDENDLVIKQIPEGPYSLMRAISNCLYFTSINYKQIQEQCIRFLKQMIDQKTKVQVYYINEENQLLSFIINNRYKRKIEMIYTNNHYDPIYSRKFIQLITISQQIVQKSLEVSGKPQEKFVNYEYEHWLQERIQSLHESNSFQQLNQSDGNVSSNPRFKRSLSDNFNVNHYDEQDITSEDQDSKFGIIEENDESSNQNDSNLQSVDKEDIIRTENKPTNKTTQKRKSQINSDSEQLNIKERGDSLITPNLDISSAQAFDRKSIISPIHFVKSTPPGISPKPIMNSNIQKFDWKNQDDSNEDSIIEEKSNGNEMSAQNSLNTSSQGPPSKRGSGKFSAGNIASASPTKLKGDKDAPLSQFAQKKPKVVDMSSGKSRGSLKFFDEKKNYGFFVLEDDGSDIFVHYDDLEKAGVTKEMLKESVEKKLKLHFIFNCMVYVGKYKESKKAVEIEQVFDQEDSNVDIIQAISKEDSSTQIEETSQESSVKQQENQQLTSEQKKKQISDRFAGFSSIIAASQNRKSLTQIETQQIQKPSDDN